MIARDLADKISRTLQRTPAVALTGPRQVGKTTLARSLAMPGGVVYLDLEKPADLLRAGELQKLRLQHPGALVVLDEVQRFPEIFARLRGIIDEERRQGNRAGMFMLLGSASMDLLRQSSESLVGRISYQELFPVSATEWAAQDADITTLWLRGGFPDSLLAADDADSLAWREDFIRTYIERDIPLFAPRMPGAALHRFWQMLAHNQGAPFNAAQYARNLEVGQTAVARYLDFMTALLLVRRLQPWTFNAAKRLVRTPKVYVRDSGVGHALAGVRDFSTLLGHPILGGSWEGFVIENLMSAAIHKARPYYYRTSNGAELDLILEFSPVERWAIEIKRSAAPTLSKGYFIACEDVAATRRLVIHGGEGSFPMRDGVTATSLPDLMREIEGWS